MECWLEEFPFAQYHREAEMEDEIWILERTKKKGVVPDGERKGEDDNMYKTKLLLEARRIESFFPFLLCVFTFLICINAAALYFVATTPSKVVALLKPECISFTKLVNSGILATSNS
jgi:hypothetical protein